MTNSAVFLDASTVGLDDLDLTSLARATGRLEVHALSTPAELAPRLAGYAVAIANKSVFSQELFAACPELRLVCLAATGTDNVDLVAARRHGIDVRNIRDYCTASVAQHVMALLLTLARRLPQYQAAVAEGRWSTAGSFCLLDWPLTDLSGEVFAVVGNGTLGRAAGAAAAAFGMRTVISERPDHRADPRPGRLPFAQCLREARVVSLHCPLTERTRGLIGKAELASMRHDAYLINTARGALVDGAALADALRQGVLAGAGIDVLPKEPPPPDEPLLAGDIPNLVVTPHIAWATRLARQRAMDEIAANVAAFHRGESRNCVAAAS